MAKKLNGIIHDIQDTIFDATKDLSALELITVYGALAVYCRSRSKFYADLKGHNKTEVIRSFFRGIKNRNLEKQQEKRTAKQ
jgi:hypothetical protein